MKKLKRKKASHPSHAKTSLRRPELDAELDDLISTPKKYAHSLTQAFVVRRVRRARNAEHRLRIAWALARVKQIENAPNRAALLKAIAKEVGSTGRKFDATQLVVSAVMGYRGRKDAQYLSQDCKVIELLQLKRIKPSKAEAFVEKHGGISGCAAKGRRLSQSSGAAKEAKRPNQPLSALYSNALKGVHDRALIIMERTTEKPARCKVVTWTKVPRPANLKARNRIWRAITKALEDAVAKESIGDDSAANRTVH